jgi:hypothetical protein
MANYNQSRVLSLRIDSSLLEAVRERARAEGRSVSGQIVFFVRDQVERHEATPKRHQKISGWLSHRGEPPTKEAFARGRAEASQQIRAAVRRKAKRK